MTTGKVIPHYRNMRYLSWTDPMPLMIWMIWISQRMHIFNMYLQQRMKITNKISCTIIIIIYIRLCFARKCHFIFRNSHLVQCVTCHVFVTVFEIYKQFLSETCHCCCCCCCFSVYYSCWAKMKDFYMNLNIYHQKHSIPNNLSWYWQYR